MHELHEIHTDEYFNYLNMALVQSTAT